MSRIVNEAKVKNPLIVGIREQLEHRALWISTSTTARLSRHGRSRAARMSRRVCYTVFKDYQRMLPQIFAGS